MRKRSKKALASGFAESGAEYNPRATAHKPKRDGEYSKVPASEFAKNFGEYREHALRGPIAVTSHGRTTGYFISAEMFEEFLRIRKMSRRAYKVEELPESTIRAMAKSRMDKKYDYLNKLLDD
jgi:prevent-host-death family protein